MSLYKSYSRNYTSLDVARNIATSEIRIVHETKGLHFTLNYREARNLLRQLEHALSDAKKDLDAENNVKRCESCGLWIYGMRERCEACQPTTSNAQSATKSMKSEQIMTEQ